MVCFAAIVRQPTEYNFRNSCRKGLDARLGRAYSRTVMRNHRSQASRGARKPLVASASYAGNPVAGVGARPTPIATIDRAGIFRAYNAMRALPVDRGRLNRALGVVQSKEPRPYHYTIDHCDCPDAYYRPWEKCKHRLAALLEAGALL